MKTVIVKDPSSSSLGAQATSFLRAIEGLSPSEKVLFDMTEIKWCCPMLILPLAVYINDTDSDFKTDNSYLSAIHFPAGISSVGKLQKLLQKEKTYVPISTLLRADGVNRERLEQMFSDFIIKLLGPTSGISSVIRYPIAELVGNIFEHSKRDEGYIFGQHYPKKDYFDICIVDRGRGLAKGYKDEKNLEFSDEQAIKEAMGGNSTKPSLERGFGLHTSKRVVCEGLKGSFLMISGKTAFYANDTKEDIVDLGGIFWQGVVIGYRIPIPKTPVDIAPYLE